jgi:hypothetical protein
MADEGLARAVGALLEPHLRQEEDRRQAVSRVATGAALEGWLAIEPRLELEVHREPVGPGGTWADARGEPVDRYWIGNEYQKVDLSIYDYVDDCWDAAFERREDLPAWERQLWAYLLPAKGRWAGCVDTRWSSARSSLADCLLSRDHDGHFLQVHLLARTAA